jgi:hypothetical protein
MHAPWRIALEKYRRRHVKPVAQPLNLLPVELLFLEDQGDVGSSGLCNVCFGPFNL